MENEENAKQIEVIEAVKGYNPEFIRNCYAVGLWIWAEFKQRLSQEELSFLKELGFRWNQKRKVWQNACAGCLTINRKIASSKQKIQN